jgi:phosphoenolpyruvate carboxylase
VRLQVALVDRLVQELSVSTRLVGVTDELLASLDRDRELLPHVHERFLRLNAEEPYRLKLTHVRQRLLATAERLERRSPTARAWTTSARPSTSRSSSCCSAPWPPAVAS